MESPPRIRPFPSWRATSHSPSTMAPCYPFGPLPSDQLWTRYNLDASDLIIDTPLQRFAICLTTPQQYLDPRRYQAHPPFLVRVMSSCCEDPMLTEPVARVKKIIAQDEDIAQCSNGAAFAISVATVSLSCPRLPWTYGEKHLL